MRRIGISVLFLLGTSALWAEELRPATPVLKPKMLGQPGTTSSLPNVPAPPAISPPPVYHEPHAVTWGAELVTPLGKENTFDARFSTFGGYVPFSFPFWQRPGMHVSLETGPVITFSSLRVSATSQPFTHLFLSLPLRVRLDFALSPLTLQVFGGLQAKLLEYDSRPTTDGGFHTVNDFSGNLDPDVGLGVVVPISGMGVRVTAGYLYLTAGVVFEL